MQRVVEGVLRRDPVRIGPKLVGNALCIDAARALCDDDREHVERLALLLARRRQFGIVAFDDEAAERVDAHRPGPARRGVRRRREAALADQAPDEGRVDAVPQGDRAHPGHDAGREDARRIGVAVAARDRAATPQCGQAARVVGRAARQVGLDDRDHPLVEVADAVGRVPLRRSQRLLGRRELACLGARQAQGEQRDALATVAPRSPGEGDGLAEPLDADGGVAAAQCDDAVEELKHAALVQARRLHQSARLLDHPRSGRDVADHPIRLRRGQQRERAHRAQARQARQLEHLFGPQHEAFDAACQRSPEDLDLQPAQRRPRRDVRYAAPPLQTSDDAPDTLVKACVDEAVRHRAEQDALRRRRLLVEQALGAVGQHAGQPVLGAARDERRQHARQHPQLGCRVLDLEVARREPLEHRQPAIERRLVRAEQHDALGGAGGREQSPYLVAGCREAVERRDEVALRPGRIGVELAATRPVRRHRSIAHRARQCVQPAAQGRGAALLETHRRMPVQQRHGLVPGLRLDEQLDRVVDLAVFGEQRAGLDAPAVDDRAVDLALRPAEQEVPEQRVERVDRIGRSATVDEQVASMQGGEHVCGIGVAAQRRGPSRRDRRDHREPHQRAPLPHRHSTEHLVREIVEHPVPGRGTDPRAGPRRHFGRRGRRAGVQGRRGPGTGPGPGPATNTDPRLEHQDHPGHPAVGGGVQVPRYVASAMRREQRRGFREREAKRGGLDQRDLLRRHRARERGRGQFATDRDDARTGRHLLDRDPQQAAHRRVGGEALDVVQHQRPASTEPARELPEVPAREPVEFAPVLRRRLGQAEAAPRPRNRGRLADEMEEAGRVGIGAVEPQPRRAALACR
ncbi:MAG: hypothetical protein AB7P21_02435 [Lautropia sp.]